MARPRGRGDLESNPRSTECPSWADGRRNEPARLQPPTPPSAPPLHQLRHCAGGTAGFAAATATTRPAWSSSGGQRGLRPRGRARRPGVGARPVCQADMSGTNQLIPCHWAVRRRWGPVTLEDAQKFGSEGTIEVVARPGWNRGPHRHGVSGLTGLFCRCNRGATSGDSRVRADEFAISFQVTNRPPGVVS